MLFLLILFSTASAISVQNDFEDAFPVPPRQSNTEIKPVEQPVVDPFANLDIIRNAETAQNRRSNKITSTPIVIENVQSSNIQTNVVSEPVIPNINQSFQQMSDANLSGASNEADLKAYFDWLQSVYLSKLNSQAQPQHQPPQTTSFAMPQSQQVIASILQPNTSASTKSTETSFSASNTVVSPGMFLPLNQANQILKHFDPIHTTVNDSSADGQLSSGSNARRNSNFRYGSGFTFQF